MRCCDLTVNDLLPIFNPVMLAKVTFINSENQVSVISGRITKVSTRLVYVNVEKDGSNFICKIPATKVVKINTIK